MSERELPPVFNAGHSTVQHVHATSTYTVPAHLIVETGVAGTGQPPTNPAAQVIFDSLPSPGPLFREPRHSQAGAPPHLNLTAERACLEA
jgi:hypothetical protein